MESLGDNRMSMTEKERESEFPVHIDLGKKEDNSGVFSPASLAPAGKHTPKVYYPMLYIDGVDGLDQLPKEGCILIKYRRKKLSLDEGSDGEDKTGAMLEIRALCLPADMGSGGDSIEEAFKRVGSPDTSPDAEQDPEDDTNTDDEEE